MIRIDDIEFIMRITLFALVFLSICGGEDVPKRTTDTSENPNPENTASHIRLCVGSTNPPPIHPARPNPS